MLERMLKGGFVSRNRLDDALTIAMIESGVPVQALDADRLSGTLTIRPTVAGEVLEGRPGDLPAGNARDRRRESGPLSLLFGAVGSGRGASPATTRTMLLVVGVVRGARDRGRGGAVAGIRG